MSSPGKALREERLAKLAAMSTKSDHDNLKRGATVKPLSQAQLFPTIPHITQLHNQVCGLLNFVSHPFFGTKNLSTYINIVVNVRT